MPAKSQNRTLIVLFVVVITGVFYFALKDKNIFNASVVGVEKNDQEAIQVAAGASNEGGVPMVNTEPIKSVVPDLSQNPIKVEKVESEDLKKIKPIMIKIADCFGVVPRESNAENPVDFLVESVKGDLGEPSSTKGRYMNWILKDQTGREKQVRLQLNEVDQVVTRELFLYQVTEDGQFVPAHLPEDLAENPSDETINEILKSGEVAEVEKASLTTFPNGEELFFLERDGHLSEFELVRGTTFFQCESIQLESCRCVK